MISPELEAVLHQCFVDARRLRHRVMTVDHLVLEVLKRPSAIQYLTDRSVNVEALRSSVGARVAATEAASPDDDYYGETIPTQEFQRVIQRAINVAVANGASEVSVTSILEVALNAGA